MTPYYLGRNSIGDEGEVWYTMADCPELVTEKDKDDFRAGVRHIKGELRLNADTEWDHEEAA